MLVLAWLDVSDKHSFLLIVLLNPVFNCSNNLLSSWIDKVTNGIYNLVSAILNVATVGALISTLGGLGSRSASCVVSSVITQFSGQVKVKDPSQLVNGISNLLQKLLRCFNGTKNWTSFVFIFIAVFPGILVLYLKDSEFVIGSIGISL